MTRSAFSAVAFCPHPPLLLPGIAAGTEIETQSLQSACTEAVNRLVDASRSQLLVLGAAGPALEWQDFAPGLIGPQAARRPLPLSLHVGAWLLAGRRLPFEPTYVEIGPDGEPVTGWAELPAATGVLVMGDGSARRSVKGPGYLDERAEPFDAGVIKALTQGAPQLLADLDLELAGQLLAAGAPVWKAAANLLGLDSRWHADVLYADAPFGVMYAVASWLPA